MSRKIIKIISLALIAATLDALLVFLHFASAGDDKPKGCGTYNERYGFIGTKDVSKAGVLQKYYLITGEVRWWRNLEEEALARMLDELDAGRDRIADNYFCQPARLNGIITVV